MTWEEYRRDFTDDRFEKICEALTCKLPENEHPGVARPMAEAFIRMLYGNYIQS